MSVPVKLSEIIGALELQIDESLSFLDKDTGEVVTFTDEELQAAEKDDPLDDYPEWEQESIRRAQKLIYEDDAPGLPTKWDIHEYQIMEEFCYSIKDENISDSLCYTIRGSGAFRRFKDGIHRFSVQDDWYRYRYEAFKKIAIEWCEENEIEYINDTIKPPPNGKEEAAPYSH